MGMSARGGWGVIGKAGAVTTLLFLTLLSLVIPAYGFAGDAAHPDAVPHARALLIVDSAVPEKELLLGSVAADVEVVTLRNDSDGVEQITAALQHHRNLDSIQILSHGAPGRLLLGAGELSEANLDRYRSAVQGWGEALSHGGTIALYGCNVARGSEGAQFVSRLGQLTGATVAASTDATGSAALGGNWLLEQQSGNAIIKPLLVAAAVSSYPHLLVLPNGVQTIQQTWANDTATLTSFNAGFTFSNITAGPLKGDPIYNGIYDNTVTAGNTTTYRIDADGGTVGSFDLTAISMVNVAGSWGGAVNYTINFTGYKVGGGTVSATGTLNYTPGADTTTWTVAPNFTSFTGLTGFQLTSTAPAGQNNSNITFVSYTVANAAAPTPPPTVTAISPTSGPTTGGTAVTITGTNLTGATSVTIGGAAATSVVVVNSTTITAVTPPGSAGIVNVAVTTPGGTGTGTGLYTYTATPPTVTAISPSSGPSAGGTFVTISGTSFTGATSVTIGGAACTGVTIVSATTITCTTPAGAAGARDVAVTTAAGSGTGTGLFTYVAPPTVTAISPTSGPTAGGTSVTITGTNLTGATSVTIGGAAATSVVVVNSTTITAVTPAGTAGAKDVAVTTPYGSGTGSALFSYVGAPGVSSVSPSSGPTAGGTAITISGTSFTGATSVTIGGVAATSVVEVNATTITAVTPAGSAGAKDVVVTTPYGSGTGSGLFTYAPLATVTGISPASGPMTGGTAVTISGTGFTGTTAVTIGGAAASNIVVVNDTTITARTPAGSVGAQDVVVTTPGGSGTGAGLYTYTAARPDPTQDPVVVGLLKLQAATAKRFGAAQVANFHQRLESLHRPAVAANDSAAPAFGGRSGEVNGRGAGSNAMPLSSNDRDAFTQLQADAQGESLNGGSGSGVFPNLLAGSLISAATSATINLNVASLGANELPTGKDGGVGVWGAGNVRIGTTNPQTVGAADIDYTTDGVSFGADQRFGQRLTLGIGVGYGRDKSQLGNDGTKSTTAGSSVAAYGSYRLGEKGFIDGLIGYGTLNMDSTRYVAAINGYALSDRTGTQLFGSLASGIEYRTESSVVSPYVRYDYLHNQLDATVETGAGLSSLYYGEQSSKGQQLSMGVRGQMQHMFGFGAAHSRARVEYQLHQDGDISTSLAYADLMGTQYGLTMTGNDANSLLLGVGGGVLLPRGISMDLDYQWMHSSSNDRSQAIYLRFSKPLGD